MNYKIRYWNLLNAQGEFILDSIIDRWIKLIDNNSSGERECLAFLGKHASLFFPEFPFPWPMAVSELRLGSDYRMDFLVPIDDWSSGVTYRLIEIESPNSVAFKSNGTPSDRLYTAIQQIQDWRAWMDANRTEALRIMPSFAWTFHGLPKLKYQIIIGRREANAKHQQKIRQLGSQLDIDIRSFDSLTNKFYKRIYYSAFETSRTDSEFAKVSLEARNNLLNPFALALQDSQWRNVSKGYESSLTKIGVRLSEALLDITKTNASIDEFDSVWESLSDAERELIKKQGERDLRYDK